MGLIKNYPPCFQLIGAFSQYEHALDWLLQQISTRFGPVALLSPRFDFQESEYYQSSMGTNLKKQFFAVDRWYDPSDLASDKTLTNQLEADYALAFPAEVARPLNIDPGYLSLTKLVLASTKNREHRIYLRDGVYGEVTLAFRNQEWQSMPWTYPDYQREDFRLFFGATRQRLVKMMRTIEA